MTTTKKPRGRSGTGSVYQYKDRWAASIRWMEGDGIEASPRRKTVYGKSRKEALEKLKELQRLIDERSPVIESEETTRSVVEHWATRVLPLSGRKASTIEDYELMARKITDAIGDVPLSKLSTDRINAWVATLITGNPHASPKIEPLSASTVVRVLSVLALALDPAVDARKIRSNPARAKTIARPRIVKPEVDYFTSDEVQALLEAAEGHRWAGVLTLAVRTGMRRGEALGLRWKDVDLERGQVSINGSLSRVRAELVRQTPKTAASTRVLPLDDDAIEALRAMRAQQALDAAASPHWVNSGGYVFTIASGEPIDPRNLLRWFSKVKKDAGRRLMLEDGCGHSAELVDSGDPCPKCSKAASEYLAHGNWHSLRHSFASYLLLGGTPIHVVSRALGHAKIEITIDTYGHLSQSDLTSSLLLGLRGYGKTSTPSNVVPLRSDVG